MLRTSAKAPLKKRPNKGEGIIYLLARKDKRLKTMDTMTFIFVVIGVTWTCVKGVELFQKIFG